MELVSEDSPIAITAANFRSPGRVALLWLAAISCCIVLSPGTATAAGDLFLNIPCDAEGYAEHTYLKAVIQVWTGDHLYETESIGYEYVYAYGQHLEPASIVDRSIDCTITWYYYDAGSWYYIGPVGYSGILPNSGPNGGTLVVRSFIQANWLNHPWDPSRIFGGDNRGFQAYDASARTTAVYDIANPAVNDENDFGPPGYGTGLTQEYDYDSSLQFYPFGPLKIEAPDDWTEGPPLKTRWATASSSGLQCFAPERLGTTANTSKNRVRCVGSASNPLVPGAPASDYDLTHTFEWGVRKVVYDVSGCHDGFPSFELYLNGRAMLQHTEGDIFSLFASCGNPVHETGEIE